TASTGLSPVPGRPGSGDGTAHQFTCPVDVAPHLLDQGVHRVELLHAAQPGGEVHRHALPVEVEVVTVQRVRLHYPLAAVERRIGADRDGGGPAFGLRAR